MTSHPENILSQTKWTCIEIEKVTIDMNNADKQKLREHLQNNKSTIKENATKIERALQKKVVFPTVKKSPT